MPTLPPPMTDRDRDRLAAARRGEEDAFTELVAPYRAALHAHCYRMLGSLPDAEDALQESLLRAWRGIAPVRGPQLAALLALHDRDERVPEGDRAAAAAGAPARLRRPRPTRTTAPAGRSSSRCGSTPTPIARSGSRMGCAAPEARYEQRESVELAFIAALQQLPVRQRAVLILRDVLGLSGAEVAAALETTPASVYSALQRAHATLDQRRLDRSQQATLRSLGDPALARDRRRLRQRLGAGRRRRRRRDADRGRRPRHAAVPGLVPGPGRRRGVPGVARRWRPGCAGGSSRPGPTASSHSPTTLGIGSGAGFRPHGINVITLAGERVAGIMAYIDASTITAFGLPGQPAG